MSEKEFENEALESTEEVVEEVVEESVEAEEVVEQTEEVIDEAIETIEEAQDEINDTLDTLDEITEDGEISTEDVSELVEEVVEVNKSNKVLAIVLVVVIALALLAGLIGYNIFGVNKYNKLGYANPEGRTIADVCEELGMSVEEFLANYELPEDMPADTEEMNAYYSIPAKIFAQIYGIDFATMKEAYGIPDETTPTEPANFIDKIKSLFGGNKVQTIDENTPWGIVLDELTLKNYLGEDNVQTFIEYYELGDEVTAETKYKEVRKAVEKKTMELAAEAKAKEEAEKNSSEDDTDVVEEGTDASGTEVNEGAPQEETVE